MSRFMQASDIHVGENRSLSGYLDRHKKILIQIHMAAYDRKIPLIIPGDLFHLKNTKPEEKLLVDWWLGEIEKKKIPTIITPGNHDHLYGEVTQLDGYRFMPFKWVKIVGWKPETHIIGDMGFVCISWGNYTKDDLENIVLSKLNEIRDCKYKVVMLHECIVGSKFDSGLISPKGTAIPDIEEIDYWAIGDIHTKQTTNVANGHYAGAPAQFKFNDSFEKGMLIVDLENPTKPEFVPIKSKPLIVVDAVDKIKDDAYYKVVGNFEEVLKANKNENVVSTEWDKSENFTVEYKNTGITDGLAEYLASKGIDENYQKKALDWVDNILETL